MLNGLMNAIFSGGTFIQVRSSCTSRGYKKIAKHSAFSALHNSQHRSNPPKLYEGTRVSVVQSLEQWAYLCLCGEDGASSTSKIMWVCGAAGAGKSAVCQSFAEWCSGQGLIPASFFFDRLDDTRNHEGLLIPTLVYQIARRIPGVREHLNYAIDHDPGIFNQSFEDQIRVLLSGPLIAAAKSFLYAENQGLSQIVILVDGLDECIRPETQRKIIIGLCGLVHSAPRHVPICFLLSSRPQPTIVNTFQTLGVLHNILTLHGDHADVRHFFIKSLERIKCTHPFKEHIPPSWPTDADINTLVAKSSGHFLYAAECLTYVASEKDVPSRRLEVVFGIQPARGSDSPPFAHMDALYIHILRNAEYTADALCILAHVLVAEDFSLKSVASKLNLTIHDGAIFLADLASVVQVERDEIRLLQVSFQDFLFDAKRSGCFHIPASLKHAEFACQLLAVAASFTERGQGQEEQAIQHEPIMREHLMKHLSQSQATPDLLRALTAVSIESLGVFHQKTQVLDIAGGHYWPTFLGFILCYLKLVRDLSEPICDQKTDELKVWISLAIGLHDVGHVLNKMMDIIVPEHKFFNHQQLLAIAPPPGDWSADMAQGFFNSFDRNSQCNELALLRACVLINCPDYHRMCCREAAAVASIYFSYALRRHYTSGAHHERVCFVLSALSNMLDRAELLPELTRLGCFVEQTMLGGLEWGVSIPEEHPAIVAFQSYLCRASLEGVALNEM